jgi:hypothetical protein
MDAVFAAAVEQVTKGDGAEKVVTDVPHLRPIDVVLQYP